MCINENHLNLKAIYRDIMRLLTLLILLFGTCATFALGAFKNEQTSSWKRDVGGVNVKETVVISRKHGGLLLRSVDVNLSQIDMKRSTIMFDLSNKIAGVYLFPKQQGATEDNRGPCFIIPVTGNYNQTANMLIARNLTLVTATYTPVQFHAATSAMDLPERKALLAKSPLVAGFCYYSPIVNATTPITNPVIGGNRVVVQGIYRPIIIQMNKSAAFDTSAYN